MSGHTKTPWRVEQDTDLIWGACNPDDRSTYGMGYSIVEGKGGSWGDRRPDMDEREANAAFIVKAVNTHEALVKALTDARAAIASLPMSALGYASDPNGAEIHWPIRDELLHRIDTALSADAPVNGDVATGREP